MPNVNTNLTYTILATKVLQAFTAGLLPLLAFSNNFSGDAVQRGDKVKVAFLNSAAAAANFDPAVGYTIQDVSAGGLDISIDQRKYVSWGFTTQELSEMPQLAMERFAAQKGFALAKAVMQDVLGLLTVDNFGAASFTGASGGFDQGEVADLETICDNALWPENERALILKPAYYSNVAKDNVVIGTVGLENSEVLKTSRVQQLHNFNLHKSALVPDNAINLVGAAVHPDAILMAMRSLVPDSEAAKKVVIFGTYTDASTGITIVDREWFDVTLDKTVRVMECRYGRRLGNVAAAKLLVSAAV